MKLKLSLATALMIGVLALAACGPTSSTQEAASTSAATPTAMQQEGSDMSGPKSTADAQPPDKSQSTPMATQTISDSMADDHGDVMATPMTGTMAIDDTDAMTESITGTMETEKASGDDMPASPITGTTAVEPDPGPMVTLPAWFSAELIDVTTGQPFTLAGYQGKVVLVETLAVWCSNCMKQQKQVLALHEALGERDDFVSVGLDIDLNESPEQLKSHAERNGFDWVYAVATADIAREIGKLYGTQFLNPPSTPMLIVDRQGQAHPLPFGIKSAEELQDALEPFLNAEM